MNSTPRKIRWGILGPGTIAKAFAGGVAHSRTGTLVAHRRAQSRQGRALPRPFPAPASSMATTRCSRDPEVDAVYIATPHPSHAEWAIKAAEAGKHVLCEKPMGLTAFEADAMIHAARKAGTFLGEAFMYRLHPQTAKLVELVKSGAIGEVRMIKSSFGFAMPGFMPEHRLYANDLAGGGILDVGGYPVSMARLIAGAAAGKPFAEPDKVAGSAHLGQSGVDEWASARAAFPERHRRRSLLQRSRSTRTMCCASSAPRAASRSRISGSPAASEGGTGEIEHHPRRRQPRRSRSRRTAGSIPSRPTPPATRSSPASRNSPGPAWTGPTPSAICACSTNGAPRSGSNTGSRRRQAASTRSPAGRSRKGGTAIVKRSDPRPRAKGLDRGARLRGFSPASRQASILLDAFFEAGGNLFDTGFVYGGGRTEALLGEWLANRGVREQSVIIGKGAHSPLCYPDVIGKQLTQSLDRLQTDHVDVYFMHRDNPDVPVGEFVDAMDARGQGRPHPRTVRRLELDACSAWTRRSPMPSGPASRSPARSPTISRWPRCWSRSGRAASPRRPTNGRPG